MAKPKKFDLTPEESLVEDGVSKKIALRALLKAKAPAIFEREPSPAFAQGNFEALVEAIIKLFD